MTTDQQPPAEFASGSTSYGAEWLAKRLGVTLNPDGWTSGKCPAHGDDHDSLSFKDSDDGLFLFVSCKRGTPCSTEDIALAYGLTDQTLVMGEKGWRTRDVVYSYNLPDGTLAKQVVRTPDKQFKQRHRSEMGAWIWKKGPHDPPFRLDQIQADAPGFIVEGEKDVLRLVQEGAVWATCNAMGAKKWKSYHTEALVAAGVKEAVILFDDDEDGIDHAKMVRASLTASGIEATIITLPGIERIQKKGADVSDWFDAGHTFEELAQGTVYEEPEPTIEPTAAVEEEAEPEQRYQFEHAFPEGHMVRRITEHMAHRTDAAHALGEAGALILLSAVSNNVRAFTNPHPKGLPTNLYALVIGSSTSSRKSTVKNIIKAIHDDCESLSLGVLPDAMTPEAFMEQMAARDRESTVWYHDEFAEWLSKLLHAKYMEGMKGYLLSFYDGQPTNYTRHSKRIKGGGKEEDADIVKHPHLSILGVTTPLLFLKLDQGDIESGLLARFAVVYPQTKPPRRGVFESVPGVDLKAEMAGIVRDLEALAEWNKRGVMPVEFTPNAQAMLDAFGARTEDSLSSRGSEIGPLMYIRHPDMLFKVAMLAAVGRPGDRTYMKLTVTDQDVACAEKVLDRWGGFTKTFIDNLSTSDFERRVARCLDNFKRLARAEPGKPVRRREISRITHFTKRELDDIEATLIDRGEIQVAEVDKHGKLWQRPKGDPR